MGVAEYEEIAISNARMLGDRILLKWEQATERFGQTGLVRPEQYRDAHFTGTVLALGPDVSENLRHLFEENKAAGVETRVAFDRWSRFDKLSDPKHGRVAIIAEVAQADCLAIIPLRGEVTLAAVKPVGRRVLIRPDVKEWEVKNDIIVPGMKKVEVQKGEIIAIGEDRSLEVTAGDVVLYEKYAGVEFPIEGVDYLLLEAHKIVCLMEPEEVPA